MGKGGQKGKGKPERDADLDRRFNASTSATSHNVNAFLLCLSFYLRKIIEPWEDYLSHVPCIETFGKFLSWIFRHNPQVLHEDLSLTLNELFWFPQFQQHINNGISYMQHPSYRNEPIFGVIDCQEVRNECKKKQYSIRVSSILCTFRMCHMDEWKRTFFTGNSTRRYSSNPSRGRLENTSDE